MTKMKSWFGPRVLAATVFALSLAPVPASATWWGQHCQDTIYVLNQNADVYACDLSSETFFTCYYSCQCATC
jgi:hypothetical protein